MDIGIKDDRGKMALDAARANGKEDFTALPQEAMAKQSAGVAAVMVYPGRWSSDLCAVIWVSKNHCYEGNTCVAVGRGDPIGLDGTTEGFGCVVDWDDPENLEVVGWTANNTYYMEDVDS